MKVRYSKKEGIWISNKDMKKNTILEVCAGSYADCLAAAKGQANRVELNSGLFLGGLTPSVAVCKLVKANTSLEVIAMCRPRGGGFHYTKEETQSMFAEAKELLEAGVDGIAFGFLKADRTIDQEKTKAMIELIHTYPKAKAVFHRAFDVTADLEAAAQILISLKADRILTSGGKTTALEGAKTIAALQQAFGNQIEILPGSGISAQNAKSLLEQTGVFQVHSSCKGYASDPTTCSESVSYAYLPEDHALDYEVVQEEKVQALRQVLDHIQD